MRSPSVVSADDQRFDRPRLRISILFGLVVTVGVLAAVWPWIPSAVPDSDAYITLAEGRLSEVHRPFANRLLHAFTVRGLTVLTDISVDAAFLVTAVFAHAVFVALVLWLASPYGWRGMILLPLATPTLFVLLRDYYLPDLSHAALAAGYLVVHGAQWHWAAVLLAALQITRESTLLLGVVAVAVVLSRGRWRAAALLIVSLAVATIAVHSVTRHALPNVHRMNEALYLVLKVPFNAMKNMSGFAVWTNTADWCEPWIVGHLPRVVALGDLSAFGLCPWWPEGPLRTATVFLTSFGIAPTALGLILWRLGRSAFIGVPDRIKVATAYGALAFVITPLLGASLERYAAYGWPAFWVAAPALLSRHLVGTKSLLALPALHLLVAWMPWVAPEGLGARALVVAAAAAAHLVSARILARALTGSPGTGRSLPCT